MATVWNKKNMDYKPLNATANTYRPNLPAYKKVVTEYADGYLAQNPGIKAPDGYKNLGITGEGVPNGYFTTDDAEVSNAMKAGKKVYAANRNGQDGYQISGVERTKQEYTSGADEALMSDKDYNYLTGLKNQWWQLEDEKSNATPERLAEIEKEQSALHAQAETVRYGYGYVGGPDGSMYIHNSHLEPGGLDNLGNTGGSGSSDGYGGSGTSGAYGGTGGYGVNDYSQYINEMYAAQREAALAELEKAYQQNVNAIDRAGVGLAEAYQNARNQTAGESELAKRNFAQYAAANGLNNGTAGQAELARNVTLQNNLNTINTQEAQSIADLELQRANAEAEYNNAIVQAEMEGDYELAAALYKEKVRYDNAMTAAIQQEFENNLAMLKFNTALQQQEWENRYKETQYRDNLTQSDRSVLADYGTAFLKAGVMPSAEMLEAMNLSDADARRFLSAAQGTPGTGSDTTGEGTMTFATAKQAAANGVLDEAVLSVLRKNGFTDEMLLGVYGYDAAAETIPVEMRNWLKDNFPNGVIDGEGRWESFVSQYGEKAMRGAGFMPESDYVDIVLPNGQKMLSESAWEYWKIFGDRFAKFDPLVEKYNKYEDYAKAALMRALGE